MFIISVTHLDIEKS